MIPNVVTSIYKLRNVGKNSEIPQFIGSILRNRIIFTHIPQFIGLILRNRIFFTYIPQFIGFKVGCILIPNISKYKQKRLFQ